MKKTLAILLGLCLLVGIGSESITEKDTKLTILYLCGLEGRFDFDAEGRRGLATISEIKRMELEKTFHERGGVLLFSRGNFFHKEANTGAYSLLKKTLFDAIFLGDREVSFLEANPNLLKQNLPVLSPRDNLVSVETEKIFEVDNLSIKVTPYLVNKLPYEVKKPIHLNLVFPELGTEQDLSEIHPEIPVIFFLKSEMTTAYSFRKNVYTAECPDSLEKLGKLTLTYRNGKLIRQIQEFIPLNTKDTNQTWIYPFYP